MVDHKKEKDLVCFSNAESLQRLALSESGFVFDPVTGHTFTVNETGLAILRQLQQGAALDGVVEAMRRDFAVDAQAAERDIIEFASYLRSLFN